MSEKNNENKKRKRPKLYKKNDSEKDDDVLKKLRDVRKNLQDSIDEGEPTEKRTIKRKRGARKLYKKDEDKELEIKRKYRKKTEKKVSRKRLARVQKRVKEKVEESKGLSKKKKAAIIIWMVIMSAPLFFITTLSVMGLELNFTDFGLQYLEDKGPGNIMISFPARNPSFLPAQLGSFEIELYDDDGNYIGKAYNNKEISIAPYQTKEIFLTLKLEKEAGGEWLSNLLSTLKLSLNIHSLTYNGMQVNTEFLPAIELDIEPLIRDAITGMLDIEELLEGLSLEDMLATAPEQPQTMEQSNIELDPYTNAKRKSLIPRLSQFGEDAGTLNVSFAMSENKTHFNFGLGAIIDLYDLVKPEDLGGLVLGPINMSNMDIQLMVNTEKVYEDAQSIQEDDNWADNYVTPIAKLITTKTNELYIGDPDRRNSVFGMNLTILKDDIGGDPQHPSAQIDWNATAGESDSLQSFLEGTGDFAGQGEAYKDYPGWYFLYNLLHLGKLDCGIKIKNLDINIFGLDIEDVSIPMDVLPPLVTDEGVLDPDNLLKLAPDYGLMGIMKHFITGMTEGPSKAMLGLPSPSSGDLDNPTSADTLLNDFMDMIEFPDFTLDQIEETWGSDAKLHLALPISINNTMLNFYCGFTGMRLGLATEINEVRKTFMTLSLKGNNSNEVYIGGLNSYVTINIEIDIYKNRTMQPFAAEFLRSLISNFTLDAIVVASFDELTLFQENYTWGHFDAALPIKMDIESLLMGLLEELVPGLVGGLTDVGGEENVTETSISYSPLTMFLGMSPMPVLFSLLGGVPTLQDYPSSSQEEEESEGSDPISDLLNGLINDLVGGLLGSDMEFELGFEVNVDEATSTTFTVSLNDFYIEELFISLGMGDTDLRLQSKYEGKWEDIVGIQIGEYFDIKGGKRDDIAISITIYETNALCAFLNDFMYEFFENKSITNTVDLRATGMTTLNLSGIFLPDLEIDFTMEDFDLGLNGSELIGGLDDMLYEIELDTDLSEPESTEVWAGSSTMMPQLSQGININELFKLGEISIDDISETNFGDKDSGIGTVKVSAEVINYMMSMDIKNFEVAIYEQPPEDGGEKLIGIEIDDGDGLSHKTGATLGITLKLYKGQTTEDWINDLLYSMMPKGYLNISAKLEIFGCDITLKSGYLPTINMSKLPLDISTLLGSITPFSGPFMDFMGPQVSQEINTESIFENVLKFSIGGVSIGEYQEVGPLDYDTPMMSVGLDLWLQTMFNMSINSMNLQLLDGGLYEALLVNGGHSFEEVAREAAIAEVALRQQTFFNSCYPSRLPLEKDPMKPYLYNTSACTRGVNDTEWSCDSEDIVFELDKDNIPGYRGEIINITEFNKNASEGGGFPNNEVLALHKPTLNNLSLVVNLYNKSHGTWDTRYKRKYWKDLGGPYFPPVRYDGYPDHYYRYHDYYAPLPSLLNKAIAMLDPEASDDALADLITGIAIGGKINMTVFSMDIIVDLNNPKLNALFEPVSGLLMGTTGLAMKEYLREAAYPMKSWQAPREKLMSKLMASQGLDAIFGDLLDFESIPLDINEITLGITFPGIADRTSHGYGTQTVDKNGDSVCWDGTDKSSLQPEYLRNPNRRSETYGLPDYKGGLDDPYFTGEWDAEAQAQYPWRSQPFEKKETFIKDDGYEWFKHVVENYAQSRNRRNPFFETRYTENYEYNWGDKIEDSTKWPLLYDKDAYGGRCRTSVLNLHTLALLNFPVTVLAGKLSLWMEDPTKACQYMPFGYTWINETTRLMPASEVLYDSSVTDYFDNLVTYLTTDLELPTIAELQENYEKYGLLCVKNDSDGDVVNDQARTDLAMLGLGMCGVSGPNTPTVNGKMNESGWVINFNVRMFEGSGSKEFFYQLITSGDFNIHFLAQGLLNVSVFGYELYDIYLPYDLVNLGDPSRFQKKCDDYLASQGEGGYPTYGVPGLNGTVTSQETVEEDEGFWPHYLLEGASLEFAISLPIEVVLEPIMALLDDIGALLGKVDAIGLEDGNLVIGISDSIWNPIPLVVWLQEIYIEVWLGRGDGTVEGTDWNAKLWITDDLDLPLIDLGDVSDPYDFDYNSYENWYMPHQLDLDVSATAPLDLEIITDLLLGGYYYVQQIKVKTAVPNVMGYEPMLSYPLPEEDAIGEVAIL